MMGDAPDTEAGAGYDSTAETTATATSGNGAAQGVTALGGATSAFAAYTSAQYNKRVARQNAALARMQAVQAVQAGEYAKNRVALRERMIEGQQSGAAAAGNTLVGAGSNATARTASQGASAMDQYLIELNARREAYGFQVKAAADSAAGRMSQQEGTMGITETLLNTGSQEMLEADPNYAGFRGRGVGMQIGR